MARSVKVLAVAMMMGMLSLASHIDDTNGELSNFKYNKVNFRLQKDCSLDKMPDVSLFSLSVLDQILFGARLSQVPSS